MKPPPTRWSAAVNFVVEPVGGLIDQAAADQSKPASSINRRRERSTRCAADRRGQDRMADIEQFGVPVAAEPILRFSASQGFRMTALDPQRTLSLRPGNGSSCPRPCENGTPRQITKYQAWRRVVSQIIVAQPAV
jgi:hypothetical protein